MHIMRLLMLLTQFVLSWSGKPIDYTPLLKFLDDDIVRDLTDPLENRAKMLLDSVDTYNSRLVDVRDMIDQNVFEAYVKAVELQKIGGPQFLLITLDKDLLKRVYKWSDDDVTVLQNKFEVTKQSWKDVESLFKTAEVVFKQLQEQQAKERAEEAEREKKRIEQLEKAEKEFSKKIFVNIGTETPSN